ncbi:MAG TPA: hypothetical protein VMX17_17540 [Candidatus Glassbacteria bacterium]|nr:hypothetical protein [Candidatus Glassbacteria bacterium]
MTKSLNELAKEFLQVSVDHGFHDEGSDGITSNTIAAFVANLHGEISELWEAYRKDTLNKKCDKPINLTCAEEELADIIIRTLEYGQQLGLDMDRAVSIKNEYNKTRPWRHGGKKA